MTRPRRRRMGAGAIVRAIGAAADRIVNAIREASAEGTASREAMIARGGAFLRAALDEGTPRTVVLDPPVANDTRTPDPTTPPGGPANDGGEGERPPESEPPRSGPPPESTPRPR